MKKRLKKSATTLCVILLGAALTGTSACSGPSETANGYDAESTDTIAVESVTAVITLSDNGSTVSATEEGTADGININDNKIEITTGGTYEISGTLSNGQIYVDTADSEDEVVLVFDGVSVTNETEPAVYVEQADSVRIILTDGSDNMIQSGTSMADEPDEDASGGALFCRDDLTIDGTGSLTVNGYLNDGIHGNDDFDIDNGSIEIVAVHHAVKANETLSVNGGTLNLTSNTDGIHSEGDIVITGGDIEICAGDDGIHADTDLTIENGTIEIVESYEGIEGNRIYVRGGDISVTSDDDGINANGGQDFFGMMGMYNMYRESEEDTETEDPELIIDDGNIYVNAGGDGLDSNGDLIVNGGYIIVDGPENSANGAIDSGTENGGECTVNGGTILAIGASGMAEQFGNYSTQNSIRLTISQCESGTDIIIADASGNELLSHTSAKSFSSIVFSSPELEAGADYTVTIGTESITYTQTSGTYTDSYSGMGEKNGMNGSPSERSPRNQPTMPNTGSERQTTDYRDEKM